MGYEMWSFEHSVECAASVDAAWAFWTDVRNWAIDADVERIEIDGAFATGTRARTFSKSSGKIEWQLAEVDPGRAVIETPLDGAMARSVWTFEPAGSGFGSRSGCRSKDRGPTNTQRCTARCWRPASPAA